ncbi:MAG: thioesterase [Chryseotalea sp. WA131a]|nr:MAG: thioesterase [Chryseotalea sp. WA131a]
MKIFCIPYAGGSAQLFNLWRKHLNPGFELVPVELAGRGTRMKEPLYEHRFKAVEDILKIIEKDLRQSPYVLYGHSLGAFLAYELAQRIVSSGLPEPDHLFVSGCGAPHLKDPNKRYHLLSDQDFKHKLISFGGTPREFFDHPEIVDIYLPVLKNDFRLAETDLPGKEIRPLTTDITVMLGTEEELTLEQCFGWRKHTRGKCDLKFFEGGHFFINDNLEKIIGLIHTALDKTFSLNTR